MTPKNATSFIRYRLDCSKCTKILFKLKNMNILQRSENKIIICLAYFVSIEFENLSVRF